MKAWAWRSGRLQEDLSVDGLRAALADDKASVWIDLHDAPTEELDQTAGLLGLHHLVVEDIRERNERAKIEVYEAYAHLVMFALVADGKELGSTEIDFVLGHNFLLTAHDGDWNPGRSHELRGGVGSILAKGADFMLWAVVDDLVDSYFPVFDDVADGIDQLEDFIVSESGRTAVERIFALKRNLLAIRRATSPEREIFNQLTNRQLPFVGRGHIVYFRDVYDHLIRLTDELDSFQDRLTGVLDAYLSMVNNNLSEVMKRLTGVTVVLAFIAAVGGIFGMSEAGPAFQGKEAWGFWAISGVAVLVGLAGLGFLRRIGWL
jgi:magnesium transporter